MIVIEIILWVLLALCIIYGAYNIIELCRFKQSKPFYLDEPIKPIVTIYTLEDGTKIYDNGDGNIEIEHPRQEENE